MNIKASEQEWNELQKIWTKFQDRAGVDGDEENAAYMLVTHSPILEFVQHYGLTPSFAFGVGRMLGQILEPFDRDCLRAFFLGVRAGRDLNAALSGFRARRVGN